MNSEAVSLKVLPILKNNQESITTIVKEIVRNKEINAEANTIALLKKIDEIIYVSYGLSFSEVNNVEPDFWLSEIEYENLKERV